jgi:flagellar protein FliS
LAIDARLTYVENEILQADPIRLVQLLYRAALAALGKARIHVRGGNILERSRQITKAGDIVNELTLSINRNQGGEIAATLVELYSYIQTRLQDANFRQVEEPLAEVETLLTTLLEAWEQCTATPPPPRYQADDMPSYGPPNLAAYY